MAIPGQANINIGAENQVAGSDTLFDAFHTIQNNFTRLFETSSPYDTFRAGEGVAVSSNISNGVVSITNTGVTKIIAGSGVTVSGANGNVTISSVPQGPSGVTRVGLTSSTLNITGGNIVSQGNFTVDLPRLPTGEYFAAGQYIAPTITVDNFGRVTQVANGVGVGTVTSVGLNPGKGIGITGGPIVDSGLITVVNTGVTSVQAGRGIQVTSANGDITITATNTGNGTVSYVGLNSNTLSITGGPVTDIGNINIELPSTMSFTNITASGNANIGGNLKITGNASITGNINAYSVNSYTTNANLASVRDGFEIGYNGYLQLKAGDNQGYYIQFRAPFAMANSLVFSLPNTIGSNSQVLGTDGYGVLSWKTPPAAGANTQIQFNANGSLSTSTNLTFSSTTNTLSSGNLVISGNTTSVNVYASTQMTAPKFISNVTTGTAPFSVSSNTQVPNLNSQFAGTVITNAQPNITSVGTLTSLTVSGNANFSSKMTAFDANVSNLMTVIGGMALASSNTANLVYLQANATLNGSLLFTLPTTQGTSAQFLTNDGAGLLKWSTIASSSAPSTSSSAGTAGQIAYDSTHIYVCIATNSWIRANASTW